MFFVGAVYRLLCLVVLRSPLGLFAGFRSRLCIVLLIVLLAFLFVVCLKLLLPRAFYPTLTGPPFLRIFGPSF